MLQQFSWGHFLVASIVLNLVWYGFVVLVYYRKELFAFLGRTGPADSQVSNHSLVDESKFDTGQQLPYKEHDVRQDGLMGASKLPDGVQALSSSMIAFSGGDSSDKYEQVGLVADVIQELKLIFSELEKNAGDKRDFFVMLEKVKGDYGKIAGYPSIGNINAFIRESAPFHLSAEELDNLWY